MKSIKMCVTQDQFIKTSLFVVFTGGVWQREGGEGTKTAGGKKKKMGEYMAPPVPKKQFLEQHLIDLLDSL